MASQVAVTECPNCGGPIDPGALAGTDDPKCPFCRHALPVLPSPPASPTPLAISTATLRTPRPVTPSRRGRGLAWFLIITLTVVGLVVPIVLVAGAASKVGHIGGYTMTTPVVAAPGGNDFYAIAPSQGSSTNVLRRVDPIRHQVLWSSPNLNQTDAGSPVVVAGPNQVFAIVDTTVLAFDPGTGRQLWQASISNGLASPCDSGCAVLVGGRLVALSKDGLLQAFDATTGAQSWSKRLNSAPRWLEAAGSSVVVDDTTGTGPALAAVVINAQTGGTRTIAPSCAPSPDDPLGPAQPTQEGEFFVSPDGSGLTVLIAEIGHCVVHYRLSDGSLVWQTPTEADSTRIPSTLTGQSVVQDANNLVWTNDEVGGRQVFAVDTTTGAIRPVLDDNQDELQLAGIVGTTLVVEAAPRYDTQKPAVEGVDLRSGTQKWREASRVVTSGDNQGEVVTSHAPIIISCNSDANTCKFEAIDPQTGTIAGSSTVSADPAQQQEVHPVNTSTSLLVTAGWDRVVGIDPATAALQWKWPS